MSRRSGRGFWLVVLPNFVFLASVQFIVRLHWQAQLVAWPVTVGIAVLLALWGRSRVQAAAPPVPGAGELQAVELPASGRTGDLSAAAPVRAAGTVTVTDVIRNSRRAGQPLAVTWKRAARPMAGPRRARGAPSLPLALPSRIVLAHPVDLGRDRFPQTNEWLYTVVTIRTRDGQETLAIPTIDAPLVHAALELANAEDP